MDKKKIILDRIGPQLLPEGFSDTDRTDGGVTFVRKIPNSKSELIKQVISFYEGRSGNNVYMDILTSAAGHIPYRMKQVVPDCTDEAISYDTDETFVAAIDQYADILKKYGIAFLEKIKEPKISDYLTDNDGQRLFKEHELLLQKFVDRESINLGQFNVEQAAELIENKILELQNQPYDFLRENMLELSAFFGAVVKQYHPSCKWIMQDVQLRVNCLLELPEVTFYFKTIPVLMIIETGHILLKRQAISSFKKINGIRGQLLEYYNRVTIPLKKEEYLSQCQED